MEGQDFSNLSGRKGRKGETKIFSVKLFKLYERLIDKLFMKTIVSKIQRIFLSADLIKLKGRVFFPR